MCQRNSDIPMQQTPQAMEAHHEYRPLPKIPDQPAPFIALRFYPLCGRLAQCASGLRNNECRS